MSEAGNEGFVFVQTNESENAVIAFARAADGTLERSGRYPTGGAGDAKPHLPSQGSVVVAGDGRTVLATNAASDDVSAFAVGTAGLELTSRTSVATAPKSVTEHDGVVCVLATGKPSITLVRLGPDGLAPVAGGDAALSAPDCDPAQVAFSRDGKTVVVTERGADAISLFAVGDGPTLGPIQTIPSSGPTPYGFAFTSRGVLVVTEAFRAEKGAAAASSYSLTDGRISPVTASVHNGRSEICWAVVTPDDRFAFTTNFADGAVSRWGIGPDGALTLEDATAALSVDGRPGLRDEALTSDGRYLYALDADTGTIFGWEVDEGGRLSPVGSWGGLPATAAGLAAI